MSDSNDKDEMIKKFAARVEYLEHENEELQMQISKIQVILS